MYPCTNFIDYNSALSHFSIDTLLQRRQKHMEKFSVKCIKDVNNHKIFPRNENVRGKHAFHVNFARTSQYLHSAVPQCQRLLNKLVNKEK